MSISARLALIWGFAYIAWRVTTLDGAHPAAGSALLVAEAMAVIVFALRVRSARVAPVTAIDAPDATMPDLTVVVDASEVSADELRTTLVSVARLEGANLVTIVDSGESRRLRSIADRFGATVMDPGVTIGRAIGSAPTSWVLRLRAGDIPLPDLVTMCAPVCAVPDVGVVQVGVEETDSTSYEDDPGGRWSLEPFEQQVVRPSLAGRGSIPWFGDEPVLIRTEAFTAGEIDRGGEVSDVDRGIAIQRAGFRVTCVPITLARVRGPRSLGESLSRRRVRLRSEVGAAVGARVRSLPRAERWSHRVVLAGPLATLQRFVLAASAVLVLGFAQEPLGAGALELLVVAVPAYLLRWTAHLMLGRGRLRPFSILRSDLRTLGVDPFTFRAARRDRRGNIRLLVFVVLALGVAIAMTTFAVWRDRGDSLSAETAAVAIVLTVGFLGVALEVLFDSLARRQRRESHRVRLGLITCLFQETEGILIDLSIGGVSIALPCDPDDLPGIGSATTMAFRIPDAMGTWRNVSTLVHVVYLARGLPGETKVGLAFDDPTDAPLDPVVEFLTIDRRLVTLGRREMVKTRS